MRNKRGGGIFLKNNKRRGGGSNKVGGIVKNIRDCIVMPGNSLVPIMSYQKKNDPCYAKILGYVITVN